MKNLTEIISGKKYYGKLGIGWVCLVNGSPQHFPNKKEAIQHSKIYTK